MSIDIDYERGRLVADFLYKAFTTTGIHGRTIMPEDILPSEIRQGSIDHILFITLTVSLDYIRDADELWEFSRTTYQNPEIRYLYKPQKINKTESKKLIEDLNIHGLSQRKKQDAWIWRTVGITFHKKWGDDPRNFLSDCNWDGPTILERLIRDYHIYNGEKNNDFPFLRGPKIGPLWIRMLRDNIGLQIKNLDKVPIPVDIHVARATLSLGIVRGQFEGSLPNIFGDIRKAWFGSVEGLITNKREMIALDVDEPLWHLSKYGCNDRNKTTGICPHYYRCEANKYCMPGKIDITNNFVRLDT